MSHDIFASVYWSIKPDKYVVLKGRSQFGLGITFLTTLFKANTLFNVDWEQKETLYSKLQE
jgi:hypothetical protein